MTRATLQARWQEAAAEVEERAFLVFESEDGTVTRYTYGEMDHVVASIDDDGFHYFDGRRSDTLKVAGEIASIVEVEHVIAEHPAVHEVAVIGTPDPLRDEVPHAFVVLSAHQSSDVIPDIRRFTDDRLSSSKRPRIYTVVDELPRTSVGKFRKFLLTPAGGQPAGDTGHHNHTRSAEP